MLKKLLVLVVVLVLALPFVGVQAQSGNIAEVAAGAGTFNTLLAAVGAADPAIAAALTGEGPLTVFAPTDDAFAALPAGVVDYLLAHPDVLSQVLLYHVIEGAVMSDTVMGMMEPADVPTLAGSTINVVAGAEGVTIDGVNVTAVDIEASNGVIHVIDGVLLPPIELPEVDPLSVTGDIIAAGSSTVAPLTQEAINEFIAAGYSGAITNDSIGTGAGLERFCVAGETDIANASRPIRASEVEACAALNPPRNPIGFLVGIDALAVVVSSSNDFIDGLSRTQLAQIYTGEITSWDQIDPSYPAQPIQVFSPGSDSGTFDYFLEETLERAADRGGLGLSVEEAEAAIQAVPGIQFSEDDNVLVQGVEGSPFAIGYFGYAYYAENRSRLKPLAIEGVVPSGSAVEAGTYPLARPLFIYSDAAILAAKPQVASFINFYISNDNALTAAVSYFPVSERTSRLNALLLLINSPMSM